MDVKIAADWKKVLKKEFQHDYFSELVNFVKTAYKEKTIYPAGHQIFQAFDQAPFEKTRVVLIGQDPYHRAGQAHGLSFSVKKGVLIPPSLKNIFQERATDLGIQPAASGDLTSWAKQGVLLLNSVLTVEQHKPGSHANKGWEKFTDAVIEQLSKKKKNLVFFLWGSYAQQKGGLIDRDQHLVLSTSHPSPFSAHRGFFGSKPFSRANNYLLKHGKPPIDW